MIGFTDTEKLPWQPMTLGGVAAFARAPFTRLAVVASLVALIVGVAVAFFFFHAWRPALSFAISQLPEQAEIREGELHWPTATPTQLASGTFLSIAVDPTGSGSAGEVADLQCEFNKSGLRFQSLLGYLTIPYPQGWRIGLNRSEIEPWWGAWLPAIVAGIIFATVITLWIAWAVLGLLYSVPVFIIAFYADRQLGWRGSWKLAFISAMPGAVVMSVAILAYSFSRITLLQFLTVWLFHFAVSWIYLIFAPLRVARFPFSEKIAGRKNPFSEPRLR